MENKPNDPRGLLPWEQPDTDPADGEGEPEAPAAEGEPAGTPPRSAGPTLHTPLGDAQFVLKKKPKKAPRRGRVSLNLLLVVIAIVAVAVVVCVLCFTFGRGKSEEEAPASSVVAEPERPERVITSAALKKMVETSNLSTYEMEYEGVAKRVNAKKAEKIDYYVSYTATVKTGIDFSEIRFSVDNASKQVDVQLPDVKITYQSVDKASLDFLFNDKKWDKDGVHDEGYELCQQDLDEEVRNNKTLYEVAAQNAKTAVEALVTPFVTSMDEEYTVNVYLSSQGGVLQ